VIKAARKACFGLSGWPYPVRIILLCQQFARVGIPLQKNVGYEYLIYGLLPCFAWISKAKGSLKAAWNGFQDAFFITCLIKQIENIVAIVFI